jgi:uncharacterized protein (DUF111 family)
MIVLRIRRIQMFIDIIREENTTPLGSHIMRQISINM